jgi:hypothetical protein
MKLKRPERNVRKETLLPFIIEEKEKARFIYSDRVSSFPWNPLRSGLCSPNWFLNWTHPFIENAEFVYWCTREL